MASLLPWWVGLSLAGISYVALHWYAGTPVPKPLPGQVALSLVDTIPRVVAGVFQFVLPVAFLVSALVSALKARKRDALHGQAAKAGRRGELEGMSRQEFEPQNDSAMNAGSGVQAEFQGSSTVDTASPVCPKCGGGMIRRIARQGANAGQAFWGCSAYPACRGTRPV